MITGAIFDMDGVVLDSMGYWRTVGERYIKSLGIKPRDTLNAELVPMSMEEGANHMKKEYGLSKSHDEIMEDLRNLVHNFYLYEVGLKPGVIEALSFLKEQNIPIAIATSSPRGHVIKALERLGVLGYFGPMFTVSEVGESKHSSKIYFEAAKAIGSPAETTVCFEDAPYALRTVKDAGFIALGVCDLKGEPDQTEVKKADFYLETLSDLKNIWAELKAKEEKL